jgi:hypothetical protein
MDAPGRAVPRFPRAMETVARQAIHAAVAGEQARRGRVAGLAGAASGGDILFHEVCAELGIPTSVRLALPSEKYVRESVAPADGGWIPRYQELMARNPAAPVLAPEKDLPGWLAHVANYSIWERNNLWLLEQALSGGASHMTLIALWNGKTGDGPGGTEHMIRIAKDRGANTIILDTNQLFAAPARRPD